MALHEISEVNEKRFQIEEFGLYFLTDEYMHSYYPKDFPSDHSSRKRPFILLNQEPNGVCWMAPLSTKIEKYQERQAKYKNSVAFLTLPNGRKSAALICNVVPVLPYHIKEPYIIQSIPYVVRKNAIKNDFIRRFNSYLYVMSQDYVANSKEIKDLYFEFNIEMQMQNRKTHLPLEQQVSKYEISHEMMKVTKHYDLRSEKGTMQNEDFKNIGGHEDR